MRGRLAIAMVAGAALIGTPALAQWARGPVTFESRAKTAVASVQAMPKVKASGAVSAPVAARINAALKREDARVVAAAADCRTSIREMQGSGKGEGEGWSRSVAITMAGPRYLAYQVSDSYYCGGPYPNDGLRSDFVYDLSTGRPVNWLRQFPAGAKAKSDSSAAGANLGLIVWDELTKRAAAAAVPECQDVFGAGEVHGFTVGLDARSGALTALPADFAHVIQACADEVRLGAADLRRLGFAPDLIAALGEAQRQQGTAKRN